MEQVVSRILNNIQRAHRDCIFEVPTVVSRWHSGAYALNVWGPALERDSCKGGWLVCTMSTEGEQAL